MVNMSYMWPYFVVCLLITLPSVITAHKFLVKKCHTKSIIIKDVLHFFYWISTMNRNKRSSMLPKPQIKETEYITALGDCYT
jgi:hypothetical protein